MTKDIKTPTEKKTDHNRLLLNKRERELIEETEKMIDNELKTIEHMLVFGNCFTLNGKEISPYKVYKDYA